MLEEMNELSIAYCEDVLNDVSMSITMYSYIADLQNNQLYLYSRGDFSRVAHLNVTEELAAGEHSYDIERLVSQQNVDDLSEDSLMDIIGVIVGCSIIACIFLLVIVRTRRGK